MINSGPRRFRYRAGLNHKGGDDRVGHCQGRWHSTCRRALVFIVGKKIAATMTCPYQSKVSSGACGRATGVVIQLGFCMSGRFCVLREDTYRAGTPQGMPGQWQPQPA